MRKLFLKLHLWLALPFGVIITVLCLSGAALVFEKEITEAAYPDLYFVPKVGVETLPTDSLVQCVTKVLPDSVSVTSITPSADPTRTWRVSLSKPRRSSLYINPYTGEVTGRYERAPFFLFMFRLHRWLLDTTHRDSKGFPWGKMIVGYSTLAFLFVLLSGIVIWVPRTRKALKNRLRIEHRKGGRRLWYDMHVATGFYAFLFLLLMAVTGLTWSFGWYRTGFYWLFGADATPYAASERANQVFRWIYSVHVGSFGGLPTRILWFIAALIGATLPVTGYYLWWKKGKKKRKQ
jgi:uncharacterized iron-regulated membrane protein